MNLTAISKTSFKWIAALTAVILALGVLPPMPVSAGVELLNPWPVTPTQTGGTGNPTSTDFTVNGGANRLLVVVVDCYDSAGSNGQTFGATYGGVPLTTAVLQNTLNRQTWVGFLTMGSSFYPITAPLAVTVDGTHTNVVVWAASYSSVDQAAPITGTSSLASNNATNTPTFPADTSVNAGGYGFYTWSSSLPRTDDNENYEEFGETTVGNTGGLSSGVASKGFSTAGVTRPTVNFDSSSRIRASLSLVTLSPAPPNNNPTDIQLSPTTVAESQPVNTVVGTFTTSDPDYDNIFSYTLVPGTGSDDNAAFNISGSNLRTSAVFDYESKSVYSIRVRSTDQGGLWIEKTFTITVTNINDAPLLTPIGNRSVAELSMLSFTATAVDPDVPADAFSFSLVNAPAGAAITPEGVFTWTPTEAQGPGSYTFKVKVCDDGVPSACAEESITVTVSEVNVAPVLTPIADQNVAENTLVSFAASASDADLPANIFTFSLLDAPAGTAINASGLFTWTPSEAQGPGIYTFTVRVCDNGDPVLCDQDSVTITVREVNTAPNIEPIDDQTIPEGTVFSFTASAVDDDLPANTLTFSLTSAPQGAVITSAGDFSWTPSETQGPGSYSFIISVCDNADPSLCDEEALTITVSEVNTAPVLAVIGDKTVNEGELLSFTAGAIDADSPPNGLTFNLAGEPAGAVITTGGVFSWTPTEFQGPGEYTFTIKVCDDGSPALCDDEEITVTVSEVNTAPVLAAIGNQTTAELTTLTFTAVALDSDRPANLLTFSLVGAPDGAEITLGGVFTWTPSEAQGPADYPFTVKVCDNGSPVLCDEETITVSVNEVNIAPVLASIGNKIVDEGELLSFTASASDADLPENTLTFSLVGAPDGAAITAAGAFSWTPSEAQGPDEVTFTVKVCDDGSPVLCDQEEMTVTVVEVNTEPVLDAIGNQTIDEGSLLSFTAAALDSDVPGNTLTFSLVDAPEGASITPEGAFSWTPLEAQGPDSYTFTVKVCDNGDPALCDEEKITVTVSEVNTAPVLEGIGDQSVNEGALLSFTASAADSDLPANTLTFSLVGAPEGASITPAGEFSWTPSEAQGPDDTTLTVKVCDDSPIPLCDEETIKVTVNEVNTAPLLSEIGDLTVNEGELLSFTVSAVDSDLPANTLTFSLVGAPSGAGIDADHLFTWTPSEAHGPADYTFKVMVCDDRDPYLCDEEEITVTVNEVNTAPVLESIGDQSVAELETLAFTAAAVDSDEPANTLVFNMVDAPEGASITPEGAFSWTPTEAQGPDDYTFTVQVCDDGDPVLCDSEIITVSVGGVNTAPVLEPIGDQTVDELVELTFTALASDGDVPPDTLTFSLVDAPDGASITPEGVFTWTPAEDQGPGEFTFTFKVCDDSAEPLCDEETITVTVNDVNSAPLGVADFYAVEWNILLSVAAPGILANDSDSDIPLNTLTLIQLSDPQHGTLVLNSDGSFTYMPELNYQGSDSFTYKLSDGELDSEVVTVTLTISEGKRIFLPLIVK